jgi:hypothetical protein
MALSQINIFILSMKQVLHVWLTVHKKSGTCPDCQEETSTWSSSFAIKDVEPGPICWRYVREMLLERGWTLESTLESDEDENYLNRVYTFKRVGPKVWWYEKNCLLAN